MEMSEFEESYDDDPIEREHAREEQRLGEAILESTIRALEPPEAVTVTSSTTIRAAIQLMIDKHIGAVLVEDEGTLVGIFTERDVLRRVAVSDVGLDEPVARVMTRDPETLGSDDGIAFALNRMIVRGFRHVPIVDGEGRARSILSVRHVVAHIVSLLPGRVLNLPPEPKLGIPHSPDGG